MARPTLKKGIKRDRVNVTLDPELIEKGKELAATKGISLSEMFQEFLAQKIEELEKIKPKPPKSPRQTKGK